MACMLDGIITEAPVCGNAQNQGLLAQGDGAGIFSARDPLAPRPMFRSWFTKFIKADSIPAGLPARHGSFVLGPVHFEIVHSPESLGKKTPFAHPGQPHSLKGFPKGVTPFGRRRQIELLDPFIIENQIIADAP